MRLILSRILSRSNCILILIVSNLACSAPLKSRKRGVTESEQGFSSSPRILEIQLPLKIASKEDLVAWSKYVMSLISSKINFTSTTLKNVPSIGPHYDKQRVSLVNNSGFKSKEIMKKAFTNEKRQGIRYPARRLKEPPVQSADDKVTAYPLPVGKMKFTTANLQEPFNLPTSDFGPAADQQLYLEQYTNFNVGNPFYQNVPATFGTPELFAQPPAATYFHLPLRPTDIVPYQDIINRNASEFEEPVKLSTKKSSLNLRVNALNNELAQLAPRNRSRVDEPPLTLPFQAVITITRQMPAATTTSKTQQKGRMTIRPKDSSDEFSPYFGKNYTLTNESGQINVIFDDSTTGTKKKKITKNEEEEEEEKEEEKEEEQDVREQKKKNEQKKKGVEQQNSKNRQPFILGDLLRTLGILRRPPKNTTEISVGTPVLSILKGTNQQKIQVAFEDMLPNQERSNVTFAQQTDEDEDEEEEEGGSVQALLELLSLAAPVLEELSDPESDLKIEDLLEGAIPLLEDLSNPDEEGGVDIPAVLVPLSNKLSQGEDGQASDSGAILGPLIQLIAPLIGPIVGPLIGPLSRISSGPDGKEGLGTLLSSLSGPLSKPGPNGESILSWLIASITAKLSTELSKSAGDSDVKSLVSAVVSGVFAGASAGSSGSKGSYGNNKDTYYAPTTYGQSYGHTYGDTYGPPKPETPDVKELLSSALKEVVGAFLKLSGASSASSAKLSGASSSSSASLSTSSSESKEKPQQPVYGPPTSPPYYAPPPQPTRPTYVLPGSTNSPYVTFTRRQIRNQIKKL